MVKAVLFDVDGVLADSFEATYHFFQDLYSSFGYSTQTKEEYAKNFSMTMKDQIRLYTNAAEEEVEKIWNEGKDRDVDSSLMKVPEHSVDIVEALSREYPLGIVTSKMNVNIFKAPQMKTIEGYFKTAIGYDDVKNHKPHPEPLFLAAKNLGVSPGDCVFIGDMESDFTAGRAAGMKVIMFRNSSVEGADAYATSFLELPTLIKNL